MIIRVMEECFVVAVLGSFGGVGMVTPKRSCLTLRPPVHVELSSDLACRAWKGRGGNARQAN